MIFKGRRSVATKVSASPKSELSRWINSRGRPVRLDQADPETGRFHRLEHSPESREEARDNDGTIPVTGYDITLGRSMTGFAGCFALPSSATFQWDKFAPA
jgi:hypothetical protein